MSDASYAVEGGATELLSVQVPAARPEPAQTVATRIRSVLDTMTGKELWTTKLDYAGHATPITYSGNSGKQYVAIVATGGTTIGSKSGGDSLVVFALP